MWTGGKFGQKQAGGSRVGHPSWEALAPVLTGREMHLTSLADLDQTNQCIMPYPCDCHPVPSPVLCHITSRLFPSNTNSMNFVTYKIFQTCSPT